MYNHFPKRFSWLFFLLWTNKQLDTGIYAIENTDGEGLMGLGHFQRFGYVVNSLCRSIPGMNTLFVLYVHSCKTQKV